MIPVIIDDHDGILFQFDFENGLALAVKMSDKQAQDFVDIVQNKLNARFDPDV
jgi:hypothetical protein